MEGGDLWSSRLSSALGRRYQLRSEALLGDDLIAEDDYKQEFSCPFCAEEFDIVGLVCHIDEEHQVEVKHGVCPVCAKKVGVEMRRRRLRSRGVTNSMFNMLRKELREGNRQSPFGGSSFVLPSSNPDSDPLLSSFICSSSPTEEPEKEESNSSKEPTLLQSAVQKSSRESCRQPMLSKEDHVEKSNKSEFVRDLLLSAILDGVL